MEVLGEFEKQLGDQWVLECNEPWRECKKLDSGESQGLEQVLYHFVDHRKALSGEVT